MVIEGQGQDATGDYSTGRQLLPGGILTQLHLPGGAYPTITSGTGAHIWDTAGNEYIDCVLGSGPLILGHCPEPVVAAVTRQLRQGSTFYAFNDKIGKLAKLIVRWAPCAERVQFCGSGSEATFYALRIARAATRRARILKFEGGFLGGNDYALMSFVPPLSSEPAAVVPSSAGIPAAVEDTVLVAPFNDLEATRTLVHKYAESLAAIIVEPMQRVIEPADGFLQGLRELTEETGSLLIFDEVVSGFRWCLGGAQAHYNVIPDLATYGKVIGGGYPLAAVAGRADVMDYAAWVPDKQSERAYMSGTLNGNPIAAVAGIATLEVLTEKGAYARLNELGADLRRGITSALDEVNADGQVLGVGPTFQVVHTRKPIRNYRDLAGEDLEMKESVGRQVFERGVFVRNEKMYLSLAHSDEDIARIVAAYRDAIHAVYRG
jgi:glutamate-1-semialdehyde 2,1-aminomutase